MDFTISIAGLFVGLIVGLTGMGGGALMTPVLVLLFGVQPLAAVSSDLVASMIIKPVGGSVHLRRGTVHGKLVLWLALGSVPTAFAGVLFLQGLGDRAQVEQVVKHAIAGALIVAAAALLLKDVLRARRPAIEQGDVPARPLATLLIGALGGLMVGMTSVGSGSLMMVMLLFVYPSLSLRRLVGTDLVQAVPLVASAAVAHLLFGEFRLGLTASVLVGALPGVYLGARLSSRAPDPVIRPLLVVVLLGSSLKLFGVATGPLLVAGALLAATGSIWALRRARAQAGLRQGEPAAVAEGTRA